MRHPLILASLLTVAGCTLVSPDRTPDDLRAGAEIHATFSTPLTPVNACPKVARILSWCARGPNYHYRCNIAPNGGHSELVGDLEAVYRTEIFLVVDFVKKGSDTEVTVHQRQSMLLYDYPPLIEKYLAGTLDCRSP